MLASSYLIEAPLDADLIGHELMVQPVGGRRVIKVKAKPERVHRHLIKKHDRDRRAFVLLGWIDR